MTGKSEPKDRSASISERVLKIASGACLYLPIARIVNLGRALDLFSKEGFWIIGTAGESSKNIYRFDWKRDIVLVLGSEDKGLSTNIRKKCHQLVSIPSTGNITSLNVSVAAGVVLSEIMRQWRN